ncbi:MAG: BON domain-containing protein [Legionellaceae bacterium]|nr:BON domain-containing protein [Legionellaceae bacterium]
MSALTYKQNVKNHTVSCWLKVSGVVLISFILTGCISNIWTGASLVYDRHNIYLKLNDFQLAAKISRSLYRDKLLKRDDCSIEIAVFNLDVLMVGHVPTDALRREADSRIKAVAGYRRFFNQLALSNTQEDPLLDSWITTKIRGDILADSSIDPHHFKIVTADQIVYLMGDVIPEQAKQVILYARQCQGVKRVVKLFKYYNLSDKAAN